MIRHILLDLDNTLYSCRFGLDEFFTTRVREFTSSWLGLPWEECKPIRENGLMRYGTTLEWLIMEKGFSAIDDYMAFMHPAYEADGLTPDPALRQFLLNLPCPCSVLTNSPAFHAERIINKIELNGVFKNVFSVEPEGTRGKPHPHAFNRALDALGLKPEEALFVDDTPRYVQGFIDLGGRGILFDEMDSHKNYPHEKINNLADITRFLT